MSATTLPRNETRLDFYRTPAWATEAIVPVLRSALNRRDRSQGRIPKPDTWTILDAGAGDGAILSVVAASFPESLVFGVEIDPRHATCTTPPEITRGDFLADEWRADDDDIDAIVMNPPFSQAREFVERGLELVRPRNGVVLALLRLNWLAGLTRAEFHRANPSDVYVLPRRPSFTDDGRTDASEYAWLVFRGPETGGRWRVLDVKGAR